MIQGSQEWHDFRSKGLGSSDVAAILGVSPYLTALELYKIKTGEVKQVVDNFATYMGHKFEPKARASYELLSWKEYEPKVFQSIEYPFCYASLDGWCEGDREILEIKCPGKETLELAEQGQIPRGYFAQMQWQIFVANANRAIYFAFDSATEKGYEISVLPDLEFIEHMVKAAIQFWMCVQRRTPPLPSDEDFIEFGPEFEPLIELYKVQLSAKMQRESKKTRELIIAKLTHPRMRGYGLKVSPLKNGFRVALDGINLEDSMSL